MPTTDPSCTILIMDIIDIDFRQIFDSRGNPTIEADVFLSNGAAGRAAVPSGASTGEHEAWERRDGRQAYNGQGVQQVIQEAAQLIKPALLGKDASDQQAIDNKMIELDGTPNKSKLGANAILAVSMATARASADAQSIPLFTYLSSLFPDVTPRLPMPMCNVLNGGKHASHSSDIQECMIVPVGADSFTRAMQMVAEVYAALKKLLAKKQLSTLVGDEGGFAPQLSSNRAALDLLVESIKLAGYKPGQDVAVALDVAASELWDGKTYNFSRDNVSLSTEELSDWYKQLLADYPIVSIEDGLDQNDWDGWQQLVQTFGSKTTLVGDDLLVTNPVRIQKAIDQKAVTAVLIKLNQIGTVSETITAMRLAQANGLACVISHRSGETEDNFIAHLAVASGCGLIKAGAIARGERTAKYNELLRIGETLTETKLSNPFIR